MSIDTAAKDLASELLRQEYVEVLCHHDADGIAAGTIMATALYRARIPFRLRITNRLTEENVPALKPLLLCDLGAGLSGLPEDTMVIDHHVPFFEGPYHVNPRLDGIDGDLELSAAGAAYLVANALGDNRDLAGLVLLGIIGDGQKVTGKNQDIYFEALANGITTKKRGMILPGRTYKEQVMLSTEPFFKGISGSEEESDNLISMASDGEELSMDTLCSLLVIHASEICRPEVLHNLWGDVWHLEREVVENAHDLAFIVDACGKAGEGSVAASLCLRSPQKIDLAYETARNHRLELIREMNQYFTLPQTHEVTPVFCSKKSLSSDLADVIHRNIPGYLPVIVAFRNDDGTCSCSIRTRQKTGAFLGDVVHELAGECGGSGGGHQYRAGATISCDRLDAFVSGIAEVCNT
ncbi:DHHA1 domain-containing protein [Methanospirillum stamsii]|uniref:Phosphoesterase n=1 Tax=Methanospirillum stamsii TaxID=1277351 RepID=A0A2V2N911_9EURY|nr:DHH family phosphoesterase [Methanospirillum stamsii]PWR75180.1 phosphoesterase [Methanospirillum stamsii]